MRIKLTSFSELVSRIKSLPGHLLVALVPYSVYLFAVSLIPLPAGHAPEGAFDEALSRLIVLGTFTIGLLSGLGAVWNAWDFLPALSKKSRYATNDEMLLCVTQEYFG